MAEDLPEVREIRRRLNLTQGQFAERYHLPIGTLQNWEQGRRRPRGAALAFLRAIQAGALRAG